MQPYGNAFECSLANAKNLVAMSAKQGTHCFVVVEESATAPDACEASTAIAAVEDGQLMIEKVILENFKSYGGRHILGPFHHVGC